MVGHNFFQVIKIYSFFAIMDALDRVLLEIDIFLDGCDLLNVLMVSSVFFNFKTFRPSRSFFFKQNKFSKYLYKRESDESILFITFSYGRYSLSADAS